MPDKSIKLYKKAKKLIPGEFHFFQKDQKIFYQNYGQHILSKLMVYMFGI